MRDAMWMGRTLAEHVLPVLDDPAGIDRATRVWEAERDRDCLHAYHFANLDTRVERQSPALCELVRDAGRTTEPDLTDLFGRARTFYEIAPLPRLDPRPRRRAVARRATAHGDPERTPSATSAPTSRSAASAAPTASGPRASSAGSDHPDAVWPAPPPPPPAPHVEPDAEPGSHRPLEEVPA